MECNFSSKLCEARYDDSFGPQIQFYRNGFDFTLLFEQSLLSIGPSALLLLVFPYRAIVLFRGEIKTSSHFLSTAKLGSVLIFACLQLAILILWSSNSNLRTRASIPASSLGFIDSLALGILSHVEDRRAIRPSTIITVYLLFSTFFDLAQARTLWLRQDNFAIATCFSAGVATKLIVLLLEVVEKRKLLLRNYRHYPPEATSGILNRSIFWWLNPLFFLGFGKLLNPSDLYSIDNELRSNSVYDRLQASWLKKVRTKRHRLLIAVFSSLKNPLLVAVLPRLCVSAFTYAQPFLINRLIDLLGEAESSSNERDGYALIGATALVYTGIAVATGFYRHETYRMITMARGSLISLLYQTTLQLDVSMVEDSAAVTLMSTDVDSIANKLKDVHEFWASILEAGLAIWLLERQLGVACVAPVLLAAGGTFLSFRMAKYMPEKRKNWNKAIQKRVAVTASMLGSVKGVKMMGLTEILSSKIQHFRAVEVDRSTSFRWMVVWINVVSAVPFNWSPVITFLLYFIIARAGGNTSLTTAQAFTSLSIMSLMTSPLSNLLNLIPHLAATLGCFDRIQDYLVAKKQADYRLQIDEARIQNLVVASEPQHTQGLSGWDTELQERSQLTFNPNVVETDYDVIRIDKGIFGHIGEPLPLLKNIDLKIRKTSLTMIIGAVGSGKTLLLQAMLGEASKSNGYVRIAQTDCAYCGQKPWLTNTTIKENILMGSTYDSKWYDRVLFACALDEDERLLPYGSNTIVGSKGITLSGGQKQRVALARAAYARKKLIFLDDVMSGLDADTEHKVFSRLMGKRGLFRRHGITTVLVTHAVHHLPSADHIIVIGGNGTVLEQGKLSELNASEDYMKKIALSLCGKHDLEEQLNDARDSPRKESNTLASGTNEAALDMARQDGDLRIYKYYLQAIGWQSALIIMLLCLVLQFGQNFPQIWLKWWSEADENLLGDKSGMYLGVYALLAAAATIGAGAAIWYFALKIMPKSSLRLHWMLLKACVNAPLSFFTSTDSGVTLNRFSQDMTLIDSVLPECLLQTLSALFGCFGGAALISTGASYMAATIPLCIAVIYVIQKIYLRTSRQLRFMDLEAKAPLYSHFLETLTGLTTIRAFGWQNQFNTRNFELLDYSQRPYYLLFCIQRWLNLVLGLLVAGLAVLLVTFAVTFRGSSSAGAIGVALVNVLNFNESLSELVTWWTQLETSIGAIARVKDFVANTPLEKKAWETGIPPDDWPRTGSIDIKELTASYESDSQPVLRGLSISIRSRQRIGICGRSGSGKSSLLLTLLRLLEIDSGSIFLDGIDLSTLPREVVRSSLSVIPQDSYVLPGSVRFNVNPEANVEDRRVISSLQKVGLWDILEERGGLEADLETIPLSPGQQQLFCMARAMVRKSTLVIMDEATSSTDTQTDKVMQQLIRQEFKDCTIIAVAHRLNTVIDFDKIAVMDKGRLVEFDSPSALLEWPSIFRALYNSQQGIPEST